MKPIMVIDSFALHALNAIATVPKHMNLWPQLTDNLKGYTNMSFGMGGGIYKQSKIVRQKKRNGREHQIHIATVYRVVESPLFSLLTFGLVANKFSLARTASYDMAFERVLPWRQNNGTTAATDPNIQVFYPVLPQGVRPEGLPAFWIHA